MSDDGRLFDGKSIALGIAAGAAVVFVMFMLPANSQRDEARLTVQQQREEIARLRGTIAALQAPPAPIVPAASRVQPLPMQILNAYDPRLGRVATVIGDAVKAHQAQQVVVEDSTCPSGIRGFGECLTCNPGLRPGRFPDGSLGCVQ